MRVRQARIEFESAYSSRFSHFQLFRRENSPSVDLNSGGVDYRAAEHKAGRAVCRATYRRGASTRGTIRLNCLSGDESRPASNGQLGEEVPVHEQALLHRQIGTVLVNVKLRHPQPPRLAQHRFPIDGARAGLGEMATFRSEGVIADAGDRLAVLDVDERHPLTILPHQVEWILPRLDGPVNVQFQPDGRVELPHQHVKATFTCELL